MLYFQNPFIQKLLQNIPYLELLNFSIILEIKFSICYHSVKRFVTIILEIFC